MAMDAEDICRMIRESIPDAVVTIEDMRGDGDHYAALVVSETFRDKSRIERHRMVHDALRGKMGGELHALSFTTATPDSAPIL